MVFPNRIFLIGYMGSGKTSVSKVLSDKTGVRCIDMDREIERAEGMSIRMIFTKCGEHGFRTKEAELLDKLANIKEPLIVSCGGGVILDDMNRSILNRQYTIFLEGNPEKLFERVNGDANRPFAFMDIDDENERRQRFLELYEKRKDLYREAASVIIQTDGKSPKKIADEILSIL